MMGGSPGHACCRFPLHTYSHGRFVQAAIGGGGGRCVVEACDRGGCRTWRRPLCFPGLLAVADCRRFSRFRCGAVVAAGEGGFTAPHGRRIRTPYDGCRLSGKSVRRGWKKRSGVGPTPKRLGGQAVAARRGRADRISCRILIFDCIFSRAANAREGWARWNR